jgi:hypothetical protein
MKLWKMIDFDHEIMENEKSSDSDHEIMNLVEKNVGTPAILGRALCSILFFQSICCTYYLFGKRCSILFFQSICCTYYLLGKRCSIMFFYWIDIESHHIVVIKFLLKVILSFPDLLFVTEVRGTCRKQFCLFWLHRAVDLKVSCSQIPRRAFTGIRTHNPLVESPTS